jgi:hypothetical protein
VVFELRFGGFRSLLELCFVSDVSSCCPCLRGPRLVFFRFFCFPFSLWLQILCVVNALVKGEIEDHVWFEDRWMVAPLCDE